MYTGILVLACVAGISDTRRIVPLAGKSMPRNFAESPVAHQKVLANLLSAFDPAASFNPSGGVSGYALLPRGVTRHRSVLMGTKGPFNSKHSDQRRGVPSRRDLLKAAALTSLGYTLGPKSVLAASGVDYAAVSGSIADLVKADPDKGPTFVRLAWHSSGTYDKMAKDGGSGGGTIRFKEELAHGANAGLTKATEWLEPLHSKYKGISYADLYTLAGVSAIAAMGGPKIGWGFGRVDAMDPSAVTPDGRLPAADKGSSKETATGLRDIFYRMGFNDQEIVALSGAHALGRCHPDASGYEGPWTPTPTLFTNSYFGLLQNLKWTKRDWSGPLQYEDPSKKLMMLPSDIVLLEDAEFAKYVKLYAKDSKTFNADFANAFQKLEELGTKGLTSVVL